MNQLKAEIEKESAIAKPPNLETLLLNGPTATKKQLETIAKNLGVKELINQFPNR